MKSIFRKNCVISSSDVYSPHSQSFIAVHRSVNLTIVEVFDLAFRAMTDPIRIPEERNSNPIVR